MAAVERHGRCGRQKGSREISEKASPFAQVRDDGRYGCLLYTSDAADDRYVV